MQRNNNYQEIMDFLIDTLPQEWNKVVLYAEYGEASHLIEYYVRTGNKDFVKCFELGLERTALLKTIQSVHSVLQNERAAAVDKWSTLTITAERGGKLRAEYCYEDITEKAYEYKNKWKESHLI